MAPPRDPAMSGPGTLPEPRCAVCGDAGFRIERLASGQTVAHECDCRVQARVQRVLERARIPPRYRLCSFENFDFARDGSNQTIGSAFAKARHFLFADPSEIAGKGLLFVGPPGVGKTHLAVSMLRACILDRGATGMFWEHKELLEHLRAFYDGQGKGTESGLIRAVVTCDVLVIDDLGEPNWSEWVYDTTSYILNARYNEDRSTIITTNWRNEPALATPAGEESSRLASARMAQRRQSLGDRIGDRMFSRLQEMCMPLVMHGPDFRSSEKRATFAHQSF